MWAKLSNVLKHRPAVDETVFSSPDVVSPVQEKHSNISLPRNNDDGENRPAEVPFPVPSPPGSPSRHRNGVFRRISRSAKHDSSEPSKASSALKLLPKKVKSQLSLHTSGRCISTGFRSVAHQANTMTSVSSFRQHCCRFFNTGAGG